MEQNVLNIHFYIILWIKLLCARVIHGENILQYKLLKKKHILFYNIYNQVGIYNELEYLLLYKKHAFILLYFNDFAPICASKYLNNCNIFLCKKYNIYIIIFDKRTSWFFLCFNYKN